MSDAPTASGKAAKVALWLALTARPALGRYLPPTIGALIVGAVACVALGRLDAGAIGVFEFTRPIFQTPQWSGAAMLELVVPLAVTVLAVQNALFDLWRSGAVRPRIMRNFAFEELPIALDLVAQGKVQGKAVISMSPQKT